MPDASADCTQRNPLPATEPHDHTAAVVSNSHRPLMRADGESRGDDQARRRLPLLVGSCAALQPRQLCLQAAALGMGLGQLLGHACCSCCLGRPLAQQLLQTKLLKITNAVDLYRSLGGGLNEVSQQAQK